MLLKSKALLLMNEGTVLGSDIYLQRDYRLLQRPPTLIVLIQGASEYECPRSHYIFARYCFVNCISVLFPLIQRSEGEEIVAEWSTTMIVKSQKNINRRRLGLGMLSIYVLGYH